MVLVMPLGVAKDLKELEAKNTFGSITYNLDKEELFFKGSPSKPFSFKEKGNNQEKKLKLASAKAAAQKQRIRILELEAKSIAA